MRYAFGTVLARLRRGQGFESAHAFFRSREGRKWLGLNFPSYLALEKGDSLPKPARVSRLVHALGLAPASEQARELARSYLRSLAGSDELLRLAGLEENGGTGGEEDTLEQAAAKQALSQRTVQLTLDQWRAVAASYANYACHAFLINTPGWTPVEEVALRAGLKAPEAKAALRALSSARLAKVVGGRASSPLAKRFVPGLPAVAEASGIRSAIQAYRLRLIASGRPASLSQITVRIPRSVVPRYFRHLDHAVKLSAVFGDVETAPDTAVYLVEGRLFEIYPEGPAFAKVAKVKT